MSGRRPRLGRELREDDADVHRAVEDRQQQDRRDAVGITGCVIEPERGWGSHRVRYLTRSAGEGSCCIPRIGRRAQHGGRASRIPHTSGVR